MAALHVSAWGLGVAPDIAVTRQAAIEAASHPAAARRQSRWHALRRLLHTAALATAMTDAQVNAMILTDRLEGERGGR